LKDQISSQTISIGYESHDLSISMCIVALSDDDSYINSSSQVDKIAKDGSKSKIFVYF